MKATVFDAKSGVFQVEIGELAHRLATESFCWLDLDGAAADELQTVTAMLHIAEPASSWLPRFGQRARFEVDGQQIRISTFAAGVAGVPIEGHICTASRGSSPCTPVPPQPWSARATCTGFLQRGSP